MEKRRPRRWISSSWEQPSSPAKLHHAKFSGKVPWEGFVDMEETDLDHHGPEPLIIPVQQHLLHDLSITCDSPENSHAHRLQGDHGIG